MFSSSFSLSNFVNTYKLNTVNRIITYGLPIFYPVNISDEILPETNRKKKQISIIRQCRWKGKNNLIVDDYLD